MPKKVPSPAEIEQAVYAERERRFAMRSQTGWDQALEAEVADLIVHRLRGENINTGLDARVKAALATEGRKGLVLTGNDPGLRIRVGDREVSGDGIVWPDNRPDSGFDAYIYLTTADELRREHGSYETPRLTVQELAVDLGVPADDRNTGRLTTVLYKLRDERKVIRDEDDHWRAAGAESDQLIEHLAQAHDVPRLSDDELARLRAYLKAPLRPSELQRDPTEHERRRKLQEILNYNDELRQAGPAEPSNATGYVAHPTDLSAYVPAADIVSKHTPAEMPMTAKQLTQVVEDYAANCIRWTRPPGRDGKPRPNRRNVHLIDWLDYVERQRAVGLVTDEDRWPIVSEDEITERSGAIRRQK